VLYYRYAKDTPQGNLDRPAVRLAAGQAQRSTGLELFLEAARDYRVWMLFITYAACFGVELTIHNIAAVYYVDRFGLSMTTAGLYVGGFGLLALFARALGGLVSDRIAAKRGLDGRVTVLFALILAEGLGLIAFAQMSIPIRALIAMLIFGLFTHMACGATYSLIPFVNRRALGGVAGIVGAGGNVGAVAAGFVVKGGASIQQSLLVLGGVVTLSAVCALAVRFSREHKAEERRMYEEALAVRDAQRAPAVPEGAAAG
jgi:MFS transporter, NNP family, nitrate/nitrite transporter